MTDRGCNTLLAFKVKGNNTAVTQGQLNFALTLLTCNTSCHRTVHFICEPIFTCYRLETEYIYKIVVNIFFVIFYIFIMTLFCAVHHIGLGRRAEHLAYREVERTFAIGLFEGETRVACCLADNIHGGTLALGYTLHIFDGIFFDKKTHTLL